MVFLAAGLLMRLTGPSTLAAGTGTENLSREAKELRTKYARDLEKLAAWCEQEGLAAEAKKTRAALGPHDPYKLYVPILPRQVGPPKLPAGAPAKVVQWNGATPQAAARSGGRPL